jgi:hypothetical protein
VVAIIGRGANSVRVIDYGPVFLLMPFGFHLAMDTLPSGATASDGFRSALAVSSFRLRARLGFSIPFHSLRPARRYPHFRIRHSSSEHRRDLNPPEQCDAQRTLRRTLTSCRPSRQCNGVGSRDHEISGSITRPVHSLSTLRRVSYHTARKTRSGWLASLSGRELVTRWVPMKGFRSSHSPSPGFAWLTVNYTNLPSTLDC